MSRASVWRGTLALCLVGMAVSATPTLTFDFNNNSMSGWHNRVWDTNALDGVGAWVDLEPGRYRMPGHINGRCIYPADAPRTNSLFCSSMDVHSREHGAGILSDAQRVWLQWVG